MVASSIHDESFGIELHLTLPGNALISTHLSIRQSRGNGFPFTPTIAAYVCLRSDVRHHTPGGRYEVRHSTRRGCAIRTRTAARE